MIAFLSATVVTASVAEAQVVRHRCCRPNAQARGCLSAGELGEMDGPRADLRTASEETHAVTSTSFTASAAYNVYGHHD